VWWVDKKDNSASMPDYGSDTFEGAFPFLQLSNTKISLSVNVDFLFVQLSSMLMSAYGTTPVVLSPPLTWMPLLLLSVAAYCTMPPVDYNIEPRTVHS
jgi:hypothetical protein